MSQSFAVEPPPRDEFALQELLRQQQRERSQRDLLERTPDVHLPRPSAVETAAAGGADLPCFPVARIVFKPQADRSSELFAFALRAAWPDDTPDNAPREAADAPPQCLGTRGINGVLQRVQNAVLQRGYTTTRVVAEPQDLTRGELVLTVVTGRIGQVRLDDGGSGRGPSWNVLPMQAGDVLNLRDIEHALENFKRLPTVDVDIQVAPADQAGYSDLLIIWKQALPFRLNLSVDDSGSKASGRYQGSATFSYDNGWTLSDLLYFSANQNIGPSSDKDKGSNGTTLHYSVPLHAWLLAFTGSRYGYRQSVAGLSQTYVYSGTSSNAELRLSRLIWRDAVRKTTLSVRGWSRSSKNFIDDAEVEVQRRRMAGWALEATHRELLPHATLDLNLAYKRGTGAWHAMPAPEEAFGEGTSRPQIVTADAKLEAPLTLGSQRLRLVCAARGQWNRTPLVPQDRFSIGNRYTVRGFDGETSLAAERGWLLRNEVAWSLVGLGAELYGGIDTGAVGGAAARRLIGTRLTGGVIGLRGGAGRPSYDVFSAGPLSKPTGYQTAAITLGFSASWAY